MKKYEGLIFITGAITLALEVLASRIMTPYFGVSLYIWSGILSITLTFLAVGYWWGGRLTQRLTEPAVELLLLSIPIACAAALALATLIYPVVFPALSQINLVLGSFIGAALFLASPLVALSAMNPLLIGMQRSDSPGGDGGAGRIFFISTVGSVAGVLISAFIFIPSMTNFRAVLLLGVILCVVSLILLIPAANISRSLRTRMAITGLIVAVVCIAISAGKKNYLNFITEFSGHKTTYTVLAEYTSMFGNIKIARVQSGDSIGNDGKYFFHDGVLQNRTDLQNNSLSSYTWVLESLALSFAPESRDILILGLGAGIVPRKLRAAGKHVTVVEINESALEAAIAQYDFDTSGIKIHIQDARTFVRHCDDSYDVAIVDIFLGDNIPDYLWTSEFFVDVANCIRPKGSMVMNTVFDETDDDINMRLLATVGTAFPDLFLAGRKGQNIYIIGTAAEAPDTLIVSTNMPSEGLKHRVGAALSQLQRVPPELYENHEALTDDSNVFNVLFSAANIAERQYLVRAVPPDILVN